MNLYLSQNLTKHIPELPKILKEVSKCARSLDRDIRTRDLYVVGRCLEAYDTFGGTAWPMVCSWVERERRLLYHPFGKITLSIGKGVTDENIAKLFGHELRHIAQFYRGARKWGHLTIDPLSTREAEEDAYEFEDRVRSRFCA